MQRLSLSAVLALAACHAGSDPGPDATPAPRITLDVPGAPFAAVRPDGGDLEVLTADADGTFSFPAPDGPYELVYACRTNSYRELKTILAAPEDGDRWSDVCFSGSAFQPFDVQSSLAASVFLQRSTWNVPNTGGTEAPEGDFDVALLTRTSTPYLAVKRDVAIHAPTTLSVDASDFHPMVLSELQIDGAGFSEPDVRLGSDTWVQLQALERPAPTSLWIVPPELLRDGDIQTHTFETSLDGPGQWVEVDRGPGRTADPIPVELAGAITEASIHDGAAPRIDATAEGTCDVVRASVDGTGTGGLAARWSIDAKVGWIAAHPFDGTVQFDDVTGAPGFDHDFDLGERGDWSLRLGEVVHAGVLRGAQYVARSTF